MSLYPFGPHSSCLDSTCTHSPPLLLHRLPPELCAAASQLIYLRRNCTTACCRQCTRLAGRDRQTDKTRQASTALHPPSCIRLGPVRRFSCCLFNHLASCLSHHTHHTCHTHLQAPTTSTRSGPYPIVQPPRSSVLLPDDAVIAARHAQFDILALPTRLSRQPTLRPLR